VTIWNE
jgi:intraflagellar transport protein 140